MKKQQVEQGDLSNDQIKKIHAEYRPEWLNQAVDSGGTDGLIELPIDLYAMHLDEEG